MNAKTRAFIQEHSDADVRQLALQGCRDKEVDLPLALRQIAGRQTARRKLPSWAALDGIIYPVHLSMEQCSSEQTGRYKAMVAKRLLQQEQAQTTALLDLTGGFGVDFTMMSEAFQRATYVERNEELWQLTTANLHTMSREVATVNSDGVDYLHQTDQVTMIFVDPARRDDHGGRTYGIEDCTPNILDIKDELLQKAPWVMLKLSPMLDWRKAVQDLGEALVREVHIVSVQNECKELLIILHRQASTAPFHLYCVNDEQVFCPQDEPLSAPAITTGDQPSYLFEPNASIMKAGCFEALSRAYGVRQIAPNSHLFVADDDRPDFPGRRFVIRAMTSLNKQEQKSALQGISKANITVRNFPMSVAELRKRLKISEGGSDYIFATTLAGGKRVLIIGQRP